MRKLAAIALSFAACLWAADFWQSKPFTEWNEKEMKRMLENSPWARMVSISMGDPRPMASGGGGGRGRNRGGGGGDPMGDLSGGGAAGATGGATGSEGGLGGPGGGRGNRGGMEDSSDMPRSESMSVIIR